MADERVGLQERLDTVLREGSAKRPAEINGKLGATAEWLRSSGGMDKALRQGDQAPNFILPNAVGKDVEFADLLEQGPAVVAFYRGGW